MNENEAVAWRWSESNGERWFLWTTDFSHYNRAKALGCLIELAFPATYVDDTYKALASFYSVKH